MSDEQDTMISPGLEALLEKVDSKFTLVSLAAKRSRQLIAYDLGPVSYTHLTLPTILLV